jgi:hypothetical protein
MVTKCTNGNTILRFDTHGLCEVPTKAFEAGLRSLRMKAMLGEKTASDQLLYWLLKDCGAFEEDAHNTGT